MIDIQRDIRDRNPAESMTAYFSYVNKQLDALFTADELRELCRKYNVDANQITVTVIAKKLDCEVCDIEEALKEANK